MLRRLFVFSALCAAAAAAAGAGLPPDQLARPPADARIWPIVDTQGVRHGQVSIWTAPDGTRWSRNSYNARGWISETDQQLRLAPDGSIRTLIVRGSTPEGDAAETYTVENGVYSWKSRVDHGSGKARPGLEYSNFSGTIDAFVPLIDEMLKSPAHTLDLLPSGRGEIAPLTTLEVENGKEKKKLTAYAITGFGPSPFAVWMDGDRFFGFAPGLTPEGWEKASAALSKAQDEALGKLGPALYDKLAVVPPGPIVFRNVEIYDADSRAFRNGMTVVVADGKIADVAPAASVAAPDGARIVDGAGKTLVPGLWDCHQHYGDDWYGLLLLSSGITSVRDNGNLVDEFAARRKRIEERKLIGPRIVPSLLIDGPGPLSSEVGVVAKNLDEALADVRRAKSEGYFAIKLYGSLEPSWVEPMAGLAHQLGLRVHGHIPHGMRPLDAVRAGYDEITHINMVMMQAMPDDVVAKSNTAVRLTEVGKYAADVDLHSKAMTDYLDELARRHVAADPTLVTFENSYVPDAGTLPPAVVPYAETLPAQFARGFLSTSTPATPELSRDRMRASFAKLVALAGEMAKRRMTILAGTDEAGFELVRELELYVEAGMTPAEALATATINPATVFRIADRTGSIAKGKLAELALVDGDPSKDIGDLRHVELAMRDGRVFDAAALRAAIGISGPPK